MSKRIQRVNTLIKEEVSQLILKEIEFPSNVLATITRAETSSDLKESRVFVSVMPVSQTKKVIQILNKTIYFLQRKLNKRLNMRPLPRLKFLPEEKTAEAGKIEEILGGLKKEGK
jgi:ribosome-binding factor A